MRTTRCSFWCSVLHHLSTLGRFEDLFHWVIPPSNSPFLSVPTDRKSVRQMCLMRQILLFPILDEWIVRINDKQEVSYVLQSWTLRPGFRYILWLLTGKYQWFSFHFYFEVHVPPSAAQCPERNRNRMYVCGRSTGFSDGDKLEFNALALLSSGQCKDQWGYSFWHSVGWPEHWPHGMACLCPSDICLHLSTLLWQFSTKNKPDGLAYSFCFSVEHICVLLFLLYFVRFLGQIQCWHHTFGN